MKKIIFLIVALLIPLNLLQAQVYCDASTVNGPSGDNYVGQILFNEFSLPYGPYSNYYSLLDSNSYGVARAIRGQKYHMGWGNGDATGSYINAMSVWIDWNGDGSFDNTLHSSGGERLGTEYTYGTNSRYWYYFTVPTDTKLGLTRVRIRNIDMGSATPPDPCVNYAYGQTFDFFVYIEEEMGPQAPVYGNANLVQLTSYTDLYINQVVLDNINNSSAYFGDATLHCNYSNFMHYSTELNEGSNYNLSVSHSFISGYSSTVGAWIDYNQDGDFADANELLNVIYNTSTIKNFNFTVPPGIQAKRVVLRTRAVLNNQVGTLTAVNNFANNTFPWAYNETEDYSVWLVPNVILPVELISYEGAAEENGNLLTWSTATEKNSAYYLIERSEDGTHYEYIGKVNAAGNSNQTLNYSFLDENINPSNYYYRLTQFDLNGSAHKQGTILVQRRSLIEKISIYPNPSSKQVNITGIASGAEIQIYNELGQKMDCNTTYRNNEFQINTKNLANGFYIIKILHSNGSITNSMVKVEH